MWTRTPFSALLVVWRRRTPPHDSCSVEHGRTVTKNVVADKKAAAEALALLGQSRTASNLNQLAHHANMGILIVDEKDKAEIAEANAHLKAIRSLLMTVLGKSP